MSLEVLGGTFSPFLRPGVENGKLRLDCTGASGLRVRASRGAPFSVPRGMFFRGPRRNGYLCGFLLIWGSFLGSFWRTFGTFGHKFGMQKVE